MRCGGPPAQVRVASLNLSYTLVNCTFPLLGPYTVTLGQYTFEISSAERRYHTVGQGDVYSDDQVEKTAFPFEYLTLKVPAALPFRGELAYVITVYGGLDSVQPTLLTSRLSPGLYAAALLQLRLQHGSRPVGLSSK